MSNNPYVVYKPKTSNVLFYRVSKGVSTVVYGATYSQRQLIKSYGFSYDGTAKEWFGNVTAEQLKNLLQEIKATGTPIKASADSDVALDIDTSDSDIPMQEIKLPDGKGRSIIYSRGNPYGAPMVWLRGAGVNAAKPWLVEKYGFWFDEQRVALCDAMNEDDVREVLTLLKKRNYVIKAKKEMRPHLVLPDFP